MSSGYDREARLAAGAAPDNLAAVRCTQELEARGMRRLEVGLLETGLSARFTGWVGLTVRPVDGASGAVLVQPRVEVRDEEVSRLVAVLRGLSPGDPAARGHNLVLRELSSLIPGRGSLPREWTARSGTEAEDVARRVADDVLAAGLPYLRSKAEPGAYFAEFTEQVWKLLWPHEAAVTYLMHGDPAAARRILMTIARPVSQRPTAWAGQDRPSAAFFNSLTAHFGVDLKIDEWPAQGD